MPDSLPPPNAPTLTAAPATPVPGLPPGWPTVDEVSDYLRQHRSTVYRALKPQDGKPPLLVAVKIGASTRIDPLSLARFLATRPTLGGEPPQLRQARERRRRAAAAPATAPAKAAPQRRRRRPQQ